MKLQVEVEGSTYDVDVEVVDRAKAPVPLSPPSPGSTPTEATSKFGNAHNRRKLRVCKDDGVCRSPMCGVVLSVNVNQGQFVEQDEVLLLLEAMKMETPIRAAHAGHVKAVSVLPGDRVSTGQVMVEISELAAETGSME